MKIGIVGKGGVGKTSTAALLASSFAARDQRVLAIDTDSNTNLGLSLGLTVSEAEGVPVMPRALIVGAGGDLTVQELMATYGRQTPAGVTLLSAIKVAEAAAGCTCAGHASVRNLLSEALDSEADVVIVDMEAGLEHLSRSGGTLAHADVLLVVMEPTRKSVLTAARTIHLAADLGLERVFGVGNKAAAGDGAYFADACAAAGVPLVGVIPRDDAVVDADRRGEPASGIDGGPARDAIERVADFLSGLRSPA